MGFAVTLALAAVALGVASALGFAVALALVAAALGAASTLGLVAALALTVAALEAASALGLAAALVLAAAAGFGCAAARRFGLSSAGVGLRAMAASSLDRSRVQRCRPYCGGGRSVFPGGNETPLGRARSPLRPGRQRAGVAALAAQHGSRGTAQRLTRPARAGKDGKRGQACHALP